MADEPMSDERLAEIMSLSAEVAAGSIHVRFDEETAWFAILDLRREVERLRTEFTAASHLIVRLTEHAEDSTYYQPSALIQEARAWVDSHTSN